MPTFEETVAKLRAEMPGLWLHAYTLSGAPGCAMIDNIEVPKDQHGKGWANRCLTELCAAADAEGITIGLTPDTGRGARKGRLVKFYRRHGFRSNRGRSIDFRLMATMRREPRPAQP